MNNLHIVVNSFRFASRILKETASIVRAGAADRVYIAALHEEGLSEREAIDDAREARRFRLATRGWPRTPFFQAFKYLEYCVRVCFFARKRRIGLVNVHHVDLLPLGVFLKRVLGAKLVYDPHELETERNGLRGIRRKVSRLVERAFIRRADLVVVVGDGIRDWYRENYGLENIAAVLNCPERKAPPRARRFHEELGVPGGRKIVLYQGALSRGRGVEMLLDAFAGNDDGEHVLVLMGYGELEPLARESAASRGNIFFKEAVAPADVLSYTASADVGIAFIENRCLSYNLCLPNKLFEYVMAGLPVIVNDVPEMRRVVEECRIGVVLRELTPRTLEEALRRIREMDRAALAERLGNAASRYCWENQERVLLDAYRRHVGIPV